MSLAPYPGLRPFHRDEADIFFGRDEQVDQLLLKLRKTRFLAVVGPSGCGKSSLIYTGLLNALEAGFLADVGLHWRIAALRPGSHPMGNLAEALVEQAGVWSRARTSLSAGQVFPAHAEAEAPPAFGAHGNASLLLASLRRGPLGLIEALREEPLPDDANLLIVVDQFEEIFRYREHQDRDEADAFVALLLRSLLASEMPVFIVITMRSDFLGDCALFSGLPEALNDSQFLTPRLSREQRRQAIIGPARVFGGDVEPALVNRLLNDMGADPDQLPVLQHALMRLWAIASRRAAAVVLKLEDYESLGGWNNMLSHHADEAYCELTGEQQRIAELMFRALSERSAGKRDTRRPLNLRRFADVAGVPMATVVPVIDVFRRADRSFLMPPEGQPLTAETLLDISHESLIRQWQRMKDWVEREAQSAENYRRFEQAALLHRDKRGELLQGLDLLSASEWKKREQPSSAWARRYGREFRLVMAFLEASERRERLNSIKLVRNLLGFASICAVAAWMTWLWLQADTERDKAASARLLAEAQLVRTQQASLYPLSSLLGIEAFKRNPHPDFIMNQFLGSSLDMLPKPLHALRHDDRVTRLLYSADGKRIVTAGDDHSVRLWDALSGQQLLQLDHGDVISALAFSADGRRLATVSWDQPVVWLWDAASGRRLQKLSHEDAVTMVSFSPDGKRLASAGQDNTARVWDTASGKEWLHLAHDDAVAAVTFSPDGARLATASYDGRARVWDLATGTLLFDLKHGADVNAVLFSADGRRLATTSRDKKAHLWDAETGREIASLSHDGDVAAIGFSPDGRRFATGSFDKTARLWDVASGQELQRLNHDNYVTALHFSVDGLRLASGSHDMTARLWSVESGKELQRLSHQGAVSAVMFSPDGRRFATASHDKTARQWDAASGKELQQLHHDGVVNAASFSPDGRRLVTASDDHSARLWDAATGQELRRFAHQGDVTAAVFSPDGLKIATAGYDKSVRLWDAETGKELRRLSHDGVVLAVIFSPDGTRLASASRDNSARLWRVDSGQELQRFSHEGAVIALAFSPDGSRLATGSYDNRARLWDTETGQGLWHLPHDGGVTAVAFDPAGKRLATGSYDNTARIWDAATGKELQRLSHQAGVAAVVFSADGKRLASGNRDKTARIWEVANGRELQRLSHDGDVSAVAFSADGRWLASASRDHTARLWDTAVGKELQRFGHDGDVTAVAFSPDGKRLATASVDNGARLWLLDDLTGQLCGRLIYNLSWEQWHRYFEAEPYRKTCANLPIPPDYQANLKQLVEQGKDAEAAAIIAELNAADPTLQLHPEAEIRKLTAPKYLDQAELLLQEDKLAEAVAAFDQAELRDAALVSAAQWNRLCWQGAMLNAAAQVLAACDKAVAAAKEDEIWNYRDSRGLVRALAGDIPGALDDFEFFIENTGEGLFKAQREDWVIALRAGRNPFTPALLASIRDQ